ncbi:MAG: PPC domain-containing protein [Candidatus Heimdallarchaeota archaeon]|nr:PPC domain-containing protein [Candidatus Heimdallarchaeota archaeon]MCK4290105.1 PPC domain-containing protein [Candidatus Heimdallarchaeota archaeon]
MKKRKVLSFMFIFGLLIPFSLLIPDGNSSTNHPVAIYIPTATDDIWEDDDDFDNPSSITLNTKQVRSIFPITDPDFVTFELVSYSSVTIKTNETTSDTNIWLYDFDRNQLNYNNNNPGDLNATIMYDYLKPGTYFIRVEETGHDAEIDSYSLSVETTTTTDPYESDLCFNPTTIHLNSTISKSIYPLGDWDFFTFDLGNTYNVTVETTGLIGDTVLDIRTICDDDGTILVENDDKGDGTLFSKVNYTNLPPGTYYIKVYGWMDSRIIPNYNLHLMVNTSWLSETEEPIFQGNSLTFSDTLGSSAAKIYTWLYDFFGISEVKLHYRVNTGSWNHVEMLSHYYNNYSISIGPFEPLDFVEYYFTARDNSSNYNLATDDNSGNYYNFTILNDEFIKPIISDVSHTPTDPNDAEMVTFNCTITDFSGIQTASIVYKINYGNWEEEPMFYDANDIYLATIGPFTFDDSVQYYIKAIDKSANNNVGFNNNSGSYYSFYVVAGDTTPPIISNIGQNPENPVGSEEVEITCDVTDENGILSVTLYYNINNEVFFNPLEMTLVSGDTYKATLDFLHSGDYVEYFIDAVDNSSIQNSIYDDNNGEFYSFTVGTPPITNQFVLFLFPVILVATLLTLARKKNRI